MNGSLESLVPAPQNEDEAMKEASLIKAEMERRGIDTAPTANDYALALDAVLELKQAAVEETDAQKILFRAGRALHNAARVGVMPLIIVDTLLGTLISNFDSSKSMDEKDWAGPGSRILIDADNALAADLENAEKKLQSLERAARKLEKKNS